MIDRLIVECERKIQRALKRLADEDAKAAIAISVSEVTLVFRHPCVMTHEGSSLCQRLMASSKLPVFLLMFAV